MKDNNLQVIEKLTKLNEPLLNQRLRSFVKVDISTKLKILESQKVIFHKIKGNYNNIDNVLLTFASLILAIDKVIESIDKVNLRAIKMRAQKRKLDLKRQKLIQYWAIIKTLRYEQNMSFRAISEYLFKYHKLQISYSTIYEVWNHMECNRNKKAEE